MEISIKNKLYLLHIVDEYNYDDYTKYYDDIINKTICDTNYITKSYELNSYDLLQDKGFVGFFLTNLESKIVYSTIVFDLQCIQMEKYLIDEGFQIDECVVISLLCSNKKHRHPGLTTYFIQHVLNNEIKKYKNTIDYVFLNVSHGETNQRANAFYKKIGFLPLSNHIMINNLYGGKRNKPAKRTTRRMRAKTMKQKVSVRSYFGKTRKFLRNFS